MELSVYAAIMIATITSIARTGWIVLGFLRTLTRPRGSVDINPNLLAHIEKSAKEAGLANIKTVLATEGDPRLPEPLDLVFICDVLHLIEGPERYLRELHGYVRPGGRVAIISFIQNWPPVGNQFSADQLERWMKQAGFALAERHDFITDQYLMIFERS